MKSVTFKFWVTLEFSRLHCNLKPKRFDFCIEYKPVDRTCPFHFQRLKLFGLLEETGIKSSVAFLKCFSIYYNVLLFCLSFHCFWLHVATMYLYIETSRQRLSETWNTGEPLCFFLNIYIFYYISVSDFITVYSSVLIIVRGITPLSFALFWRFCLLTVFVRWRRRTVAPMDGWPGINHVIYSVPESTSIILTRR